jgi:hypothetical protein
MIAANLIAISWFGMWMGMTSKSINLATLKTLLFVQVIPGLAIAFASAMAIPLLLMPMLLKGGFSSNPSSWVASKMMNWFPLLSVALTTVLSIGKDIGFIVWARRTLYSSFREQAMQTLGPFRYVAPPVVPPPVAPPPVIPLQS